MVPVKVLAITNGVTPDPITGPFDVPEWMVIKSVAILLVKRSVCPLTAPDSTEYSPAKEQVVMVVRAPVGLMAMVPLGNWEVLVHWLNAVYPFTNRHESSKKYIFFIS